LCCHPWVLVGSSKRSGPPPLPSRSITSSKRLFFFPTPSFPLPAINSLVPFFPTAATLALLCGLSMLPTSGRFFRVPSLRLFHGPASAFCVFSWEPLCAYLAELPARHRTRRSTFLSPTDAFSARFVNFFFRVVVFWTRAPSCQLLFFTEQD